MTNASEIAFSAHDEPTAKRTTYALPLPDWNQMVEMANHLSTREAEMPLRRRMAEYLETTSQA